MSENEDMRNVKVSELRKKFERITKDQVESIKNNKECADEKKQIRNEEKIEDGQFNSNRNIFNRKESENKFDSNNNYEKVYHKDRSRLDKHSVKVFNKTEPNNRFIDNQINIPKSEKETSIENISEKDTKKDECPISTNVETARPNQFESIQSELKSKLTKKFFEDERFKKQNPFYSHYPYK